MFSAPSIKAVAASLLLASSASAHIIMANPVPFSADKLELGPISASQYPCQSDKGFTLVEMNNMTVGSDQTLSFKGTAVHGGGGCQLSITTDEVPSKDSDFRVIKSFEGGCPGVDGQASEFTFQIPDSIPDGQVTLAWTWFSKESGGPELYMNCAPVMVSGGASDTTEFEKLPQVFVANIGDTVDCTTVNNEVVKFPNPGTTVETYSGTEAVAPEGSQCDSNPFVSSSSGSSSSSSGSNDTSAATSAGAVQSTAAAFPIASSAAANNGGVFAPSATTLITSTPVASSAAAVPVASTPAVVAPVSSATSAAPVASGTGSANGSTTCSTDGALVCNGASQFGLCNHGEVVWQATAAGTTCEDGQIVKRDGTVLVGRGEAARAAFAASHPRRFGRRHGRHF